MAVQTGQALGAAGYVLLTKGPCETAATRCAATLARLSCDYGVHLVDVICLSAENLASSRASSLRFIRSPELRDGKFAERISRTAVGDNTWLEH